MYTRTFWELILARLRWNSRLERSHLGQLHPLASRPAARVRFTRRHLDRCRDGTTNEVVEPPVVELLSTFFASASTNTPVGI